MQIRMSESIIFSLTVIFKCKTSNSRHFISLQRAFCSPMSGAGVHNSFSLPKVCGWGAIVTLAIIRAFCAISVFIQNYNPSWWLSQLPVLWYNPNTLVKRAKPISFLYLELPHSSCQKWLPCISSLLAFHILSNSSRSLHLQGLCTGSFSGNLFPTYS